MFEHEKAERIFSEVMLSKSWRLECPFLVALVTRWSLRRQRLSEACDHHHILGPIAFELADKAN